MSHTNHPRRMQYARDTRDARGQHVFFFAPGATISTVQAANLLGSSDDTVRRMCEEGILRYYVQRPNRKKSPWRVLKDDVYRHMGKLVERFALDEPSVPQKPQGPKPPHGK